jgi:adenylate cyclase
LFGVAGNPEHAARQALRAAATMQQALRELNARFGRQWLCKAKIALSVHAGRVLIGEVSGDVDAMIAVGNALEVALQLRAALAVNDKSFGVSLPAITACNLEVPSDGFETIELKTETGSITAYLSDLAMRIPQDSAAPAAWRALADRASGLAQDMIRT